MGLVCMCDLWLSWTASLTMFNRKRIDCDRAFLMIANAPPFALLECQTLLEFMIRDANVLRELKNLT